jgi:4-hydroxy-tetrahydrodipicolinate synthase
METLEVLMKGVYTALITPFTKEKEVDIEAFNRLLERQEAAGIDGIVIGGTTGEGWSLTPSELKLLLTLAKNTFTGEVVLGTGAISTKQTVENTRNAKEWGADSALVIVPFYNCPSEEGVLAHFSEVSKCNFPIMAYHHPKRTSIKLSVDCLLRICSLPNIVSLKDSSSDERIYDALHDKTFLFCGNDPEMQWAKKHGCCGIVSVVSNLLPVETLNFFQRDEKDEDWTFFEVLNKLYREVNPSGIKAACKKEGLCLEYLRLPLVPFSERASLELNIALDRCLHKEIANN